MIDAYPKGGYSFQNVGVDDYSGGYQIGEYLHSCGYHRALFCCGNGADSDYARWLDSNRLWKKWRLLQPLPYVVVPQEPRRRLKKYEELLPHFLETKALAFSSDYTAVEAINFLQTGESGFRIRFPLPAFDDNFLCADRQAKADHHSSGCSSESSSGLAEAASMAEGKEPAEKKCKRPCLACKERFCKRVAGSLFYVVMTFPGTSSKYGWKLFLEASSALLLKLHKKKQKSFGSNLSFTRNLLILNGG